MSDLLPEDVMQTNSSESQEPKARGRGIPLKACVDCGEVWKYTHYCSAESEKCGSCGKTGHYTRLCRFSSSQAKKNDSGKDNNEPEKEDNDQSPQGQGEECEQTSVKEEENKENSNCKESYDFFEDNHCENERKRKHSSAEENDDNCDRKKSRDTAYSFPGGDQPVYSKKTKYAFNFAGQSRYNPQPEANRSGPGYTFIPGTQYESIELKKKLAKQFYVQGKYEAALSHYSRLTELCPNDVVNFSNKCACYMMLGQYERAFTDAVKAIDLNPSFVKGHCRVIKCGILLGNTTSVELSFSKLSLLDPNNETLQLASENLNKLKNYLEMEKIAVSSRNYQEALQIAEDCLQISPQSLAFKLKKAEYLTLVERYDDSTEVVDEILQKDPGNIDAKYIRGLILYYHKSVRRSMEHFKEILHLAPDHAKVLAIYKKTKLIVETVEKSEEAFRSKNHAEAHKLYSSTLQMDLQNTRLRKHTYNAMGFSSFLMKNFQRAINEFSEAIKIDSKFTIALKSRGKAYMQLKNYEEAIADFSRLCNLKTDGDCQKLLQDAEKQLALVKKNSHEILGVHKNASIMEIEKAYKDKAKIHHPDRHSSDTLEQKKMHERKFKSITLAYRNLVARFNGKKKMNANETFP